ncbi:MAG: sirohydrochlorin chelatase [Prochloraceae cyanobacterium]|nr:sirohydrochlorin chelatase [Prochloraceae cyanobacterium]
MKNSSAYLLVVHGSRNPNYQIALEQLANSVRQQFQLQQYDREKLATRTSVLTKWQSPLVGTASLELSPVPLHETIEQFSRQVIKAGLKKLYILPLFLLPGVHVKEDIPAEIALAQQILDERLKLELLPYLGSDRSLVSLVAKQFAILRGRSLEDTRSSARILLSHGSRRPGGNQPCEAIASELHAYAAYCSVSPSLAEQIENLAVAGFKKIAIVPYFLFTGGITKAIVQEVQKLQANFNTIELLLGQPLGITRELATSIVEGLYKNEPPQPKVYRKSIPSRCGTRRSRAANYQS